MLNLLKRKRAKALTITADPSATREDLQIRNLLDYPALRHAMGLDVEVESADRQLQDLAA